MQAIDPTGTSHGKIIGRGGLAQAEATMQQRSVIGLRMIRGLGDEDERVERGGIDTESIEQTRGRIGAEIQRGHTRSRDAPLLEPQGLGGALQDGPINPRGQSVRDIITHDGSRRHGDAG